MGEGELAGCRAHPLIALALPLVSCNYKPGIARLNCILWVIATAAEIGAAMNDALAVRRKAPHIMEFHALAHIDLIQKQVNFDFLGLEGRIEAMVAVGAALAVNCVSSVKHRMAVAKNLDMSEDDFNEIVKLVAFIKKRAEPRVEMLVGLVEQGGD